MKSIFFRIILIHDWNLLIIISSISKSHFLLLPIVIIQSAFLSILNIFDSNCLLFLLLSNILFFFSIVTKAFPQAQSKKGQGPDSTSFFYVPFLVF